MKLTNKKTNIFPKDQEKVKALLNYFFPIEIGIIIS